MQRIILIIDTKLNVILLTMGKNQNWIKQTQRLSVSALKTQIGFNENTKRRTNSKFRFIYH